MPLTLTWPMLPMSPSETQSASLGAVSDSVTRHRQAVVRVMGWAAWGESDNNVCTYVSVG